jgi:spore coat protein SA
MDGVNRPKIVIVTPGTFAVPSDFSSSVERVVDALSRRMEKDANLVIFSKRIRGFTGYERKGNITHIRPKFRGRIRYRTSVQRWINRLRPDLIQVENRPSYVMTIKRSNPNIPVWLALHSVTFLNSPKGSNRHIYHGLKSADRIIVNSEFLKEELIRQYRFCQPKILVNHPGTDENIFVSKWSPAIQAEREQLKRNMGYENKRIVLYAGRLIEIKGVHHLLNIWSDVVRQYPDAVLLIVGSAYYGSDRLTAYVRGLHQIGNTLPNNVRFVPFAPYHRMPQWFRIADVAVLPSIGKEAFGLVNVEAMASGVPIIAGDAGGIHEIIEHGMNGYLLNLNAIESELRLRLLELLHDDSRCQQFGEYGVQMVSKRFTWGKAAERQINLYRRYTHIFNSASDHA